MASFLVLSFLGLVKHVIFGNPSMFEKNCFASSRGIPLSITSLWNFGNYVCDFQVSGTWKRGRESRKLGQKKIEPVMFDMEPFDGKKVACTKYQASGKPNEDQMLKMTFVIGNN